ncbi:MAG: glutamyl-tRNA reductase [Candidatus Marsarchaeota archaeon]|nr:glutamyl-tRNA reductase [Candidatus Marsarchaeota archaeon]
MQSEASNTVSAQFGAGGGSLFALAVTHNTVPIPELQKYSILARIDLYEAGRRFRDAGCRGVVILETCNRIEVYADVDQPSSAGPVLDVWSGVAGERLTSQYTLLEGDQLVRHIFSVAAGLDSAVIGEAEILSQLKTAYFRSAELDLVTPGLDYLFHAAMVVGKRVRERTRLSSGHVSVAASAVALAKSLTQGHRALVVGAGSLGAKIARILSSEGFSVYVANRTFEKALTLCSGIGAQPVLINEIPDVVGKVDVVFSATSATSPPVGADVLNSVRSHLVVVDASTHAPLDKAQVHNPLVSVRTLEDVKAVSRRGSDMRKEESIMAWEIVEDAVRQFNAKRGQAWVEDLIKAIYVNAEEVRRSEVKKALAKVKRSSDVEEEVFESMSKSIVNKLLDEQSTLLRSLARYDPNTPVERLFELLRIELLNQL